MGYIYTTFGPDKKPEILPVPEGELPDHVADKHGWKNCIWEYCQSESEAKRHIETDPNGKIDSW
jgi:hypothetical protein